MQAAFKSNLFNWIICKQSYWHRFHRHEHRSRFWDTRTKAGFCLQTLCLLLTSIRGLVRVRASFPTRWVGQNRPKLGRHRNGRLLKSKRRGVMKYSGNDAPNTIALTKNDFFVFMWISIFRCRADVLCIKSESRRNIHHKNGLVLFCKTSIIRASLRGRGEIGRRTGFRFQRRKAWEFESLHPHHTQKAA